MQWAVVFHRAFEAEFAEFPLDVKESLAAAARLLGTYGPKLGRPHADALKGM